MESNTFKAGGLRSENRVYYGTYTVRAKTKLNSNCNSFITFSMMLPIKDAKFPKLGYWEEIAIGFNSKIQILYHFLLSHRYPQQQNHR